MDSELAGDSGPTPVFIISYNRGELLERAIASYRRLARAVDIVVRDNGSTDPATIAALARIESGGGTVFRHPPIGHPDDLNAIDETVSAYFAGNRPRRYVVTDCDIDLSIALPDALGVFDELLDRFPDASCVGPMLRIRDIPIAYPLYNRVMNRHIEQFWRHSPHWIETSFGTVAYQRAGIDTTFALHRAGEPFRRLKPGLRVYEPYEALHADWYLTDFSDSYHQTSNASISHWNNRLEYERFRDEPLLWTDYRTVERGADGGLAERTRMLPIGGAG